MLLRGIGLHQSQQSDFIQNGGLKTYQWEPGEPFRD